MSVLAFSPEVMESRRKGIGASEIGQIIRLSPYGGPHSIWLEKTGRAPAFEGNEYTRYGSFMEGGIRDHYAYLTGHTVVEGSHLVHPKYPLVRATPDGLVNSDRIVQIKTQSFRVTRNGTWGEPGTHDFPAWLWPQITWEMAVAGRQWADVVVQLAGIPTPLIYPDCPFDAELFEGMREAAERFWRDYVLADREPPLDGTDASSEYIKRMHPVHTHESYVQDDSPDMAALVTQFMAAKEHLKEAELAAKSLQNQIAARIGSNAGIEGKWGGISYTTSHRSKVDYDALCRDRAISDTDLARYTTLNSFRTMRVRSVK